VKDLHLKKRWLLSGIILFLVVSLAGAIIISNAAQPGGVDELRTVVDIISLLKLEYVDPVNTLDLFGAYIKYGDINKMLQILDDPYTRYMDAKAYKQSQIDTKGEYGGLGITVGIRRGLLTIIAPFKDTPADRVGLRGGDNILSINGRSTEGMSLDEAVSLMRGEPGTSIVLSIGRTNQEETVTFDVELVREVIEVTSVYSQVIPPDGKFPFLTESVGYIAISNFAERTDAELVSILDELLRQDKVEGLIIDLRNNPGGLLTTSLQLANRFIPSGPLLHVVGKEGKTQAYMAQPEWALSDLPPLVVLVNEYSASASEILSGALKDRKVATVVGKTTFGKGLVQTLYPLRTGGLSLTTARFMTAGGNMIHGVGVAPDIEVDWTIEEQEELYLTNGEIEVVTPYDPQLTEALKVLQEKMEQMEQTELPLAG
jgi:carboxyl-terminal processing protease